MKELRGKRALEFIEKWYCSSASKLDDVYYSYSKEKEYAFNYCYRQFLDEGQIDENVESIGFRIISWNKNEFTVGWLLHNMRTGEWLLRVETKSNSYFIRY